MVNCPKCGKTLTKPERKIENSAFIIELYRCDQCGTTFKRFI
jgi:transposase-like protein